MKKNIQYKSSELLRKEKKLALLLILPTICLVLSIVLIPLIANFWISFKPISLGDLRPPTLIIKENIRGKLSKSGEIAQIHYRYRNSSTKYDLNEVIFTDFILSIDIREIKQDTICSVESNKLICNLGKLKAKSSGKIILEVSRNDSWVNIDDNPKNINQ